MLNIIKKIIQNFSSVNKMIIQLNRLEKDPIYFGKKEGNFKHEKLLAMAQDTLFKNKQNENVTELKQKIAALQYRLEKIPLKFNQKIFDQLKEEAAKWKANHLLINYKTLNINDLIEIEKIACHEDFARVALSDSSLKEKLFNWVLRDQNDSIMFIQFPAIIDRMNQCNLNGRLSCHGGHLLKIHKKRKEYGCCEKIVTLPFEGKEMSILDEDVVLQFRGHVKAAIKEIFEVFKNKNIRVGNFEFMKGGIINWNIHHLGYWDDLEKVYKQIDVEQEQWWMQLPYFETLTLKQVQLRYGYKVDGTIWIASASATRGLANLSYEQTHAFLELAIPIGKGMYGIYDFGKLAYKYPRNFLETMDMFCKNVYSTIAFPDDNVFYSHRQHALRSFPITPTQGIKLMNLIKQDILQARAYNLIYQIESENCAKWVHGKLEEILGNHAIPNLYRMQLLNTEPEGPVFKLFSLIKKLPEKWQVPLLTTLHLPLGAAKKTWIKENGVAVAKSLKNHSFFYTGEVYLPAFMHDQLLRGSLKCPLGNGDVYFTVGLLSDKHRFNYVLRLRTIEERTYESNVEKKLKEQRSYSVRSYLGSVNASFQNLIEFSLTLPGLSFVKLTN